MGAPQVAQRLLDGLFEELHDVFCLIDDVAVCSETVEAHLHALEEREREIWGQPRDLTRRCSNFI